MNGSGRPERTDSLSPDRRAFTLIELLVVIAIIAVLAAILFPVFASARGKARQAACQSNLRQFGLAIQMYTQDNDGIFPYALDASDTGVTSIWAVQPAACYAQIKQMAAAGDVLYYHQAPPGSGNWVPGVLDSYLKSRALWRCPSDSGFDILDNNDSCNGPCSMPSRPTMYDSRGASYLWHTELGVAQRNIDTLAGTTPDGQSVGPSAINLIFDGNGSWHGSPFALGRRGLRYPTLFVDGHCKLLPWDDYNRAWQTSLTPSGSGPCP
jgi:prepilin-type N-terminal cleavage/methylation domain-containing protein